MKNSIWLYIVAGVVGMATVRGLTTLYRVEGVGALIVALLVLGVLAVLLFLSAKRKLIKGWMHRALSRIQATTTQTTRTAILVAAAGWAVLWTTLYWAGLIDFRYLDGIAISLRLALLTLGTTLVTGALIWFMEKQK